MKGASNCRRLAAEKLSLIQAENKIYELEKSEQLDELPDAEQPSDTFSLVGCSLERFLEGASTIDVPLQMRFLIMSSAA